MPMYEYKCRACGSVFEELVNQISQATLPCPKCSSKDTEKLMSACGTIMGGGKADFGCPSASSCAAAGGGCCGGGGCGMMGG
jgi:putative FmdB family regulatory protein